MTFAQSLESGAFPVALEITPPRRPQPRVLLRRARLLSAAQAVNVIQRPGRQSSLEASLALQASGLEPVWHLVNRGRSRHEIEAEVAAAAVGRAHTVLCLRGDHTATDLDTTPTIRETITLVRQRIPTALIGATMNQHAQPGPVLRNLIPKLAAGARFVQTQPVFDLAALEPLATKVKDESPGVAIVGMAMPVLSTVALDAIERRLGFVVGERLRATLDREGEAGGWAAFEETLAQLRTTPLVDAVAIMTFEMDPPPPFAHRLRQALAASSQFPGPSSE